MNTGAIVTTIFKEYLKPITYYSTLAKIFGPHYFLFFAFILNNMVPKNYNGQASQKVSYNAEEQVFWLGFFLIAIASTVVSSIVSLIAGDTFLLIASSTEAGSMQE